MHLYRVNALYLIFYLKLHACVLSHFSRVRLCVTPWTLLSMGFSKQEYWNGLLCPPPGDLPDSGIESTSLMSPVLVGRFFSTEPTREANPTLISIL